MRAMILAAGRGERMRPLTDKTPKPLLEIGGKPLIIHQIERLRAGGFEQIVINLAWLGRQIEQRLGDGSEWGVSIAYSHEPAGALETAGGIRHALELLGDQPFVVVNSDILSDYPMARLREMCFNALAHLVLVKNPPHHETGDFALSCGRVKLGGGPRHTYSGIGLYDPALFVGLEAGFRPLRPVLEQAIAAGRVGGELHAGLWIDIGTPERLRQIDADFD